MQSFDTAWAKSCPWELAETGQKRSVSNINIVVCPRLLLPKRKPSAAKSAKDLEDSLYQEWERLKMQALYSLREFFRKGGDGGTVPEVFSVRPDPHGGGLNNFSCNFWQPD